MSRRDSDQIESWTDADLAAAYNDGQNKDGWTEWDLEWANELKAEMERRNPILKAEPRRHRPVAQSAPMVQPVNDKLKQLTFEEMYKDFLQK